MGAKTLNPLISTKIRFNFNIFAEKLGSIYSLIFVSINCINLKFKVRFLFSYNGTIYISLMV